MKLESNRDTKFYRCRKAIALLFLLSAVTINLLPNSTLTSEKIQKALLLDETAEQLLERAEILQSLEVPDAYVINEICER